MYFLEVYSISMYLLMLVRNVCSIVIIWIYLCTTETTKSYCINLNSKTALRVQRHNRNNIDTQDQHKTGSPLSNTGQALMAEELEQFRQYEANGYNQEYSEEEAYPCLSFFLI